MVYLDNKHGNVTIYMQYMWPIIYDEERDHTICGEVFSVSTSKSWTPETSQTTSAIANTRMEVGAVTMDFDYPAVRRGTIQYG